jgi:hypothetical protein
VDFTTGHRYPGGQAIRVYRDLSEVPVFVRPGAVIPLDGGPRFKNGCPLPETLLFRVFAGGSGGCRVVEDNGRADYASDYRSVETRCEVEVHDGTAPGGEFIPWGMTVTVSPPVGDGTLIPQSRRYIIELVGVKDGPDEATAACEASYDAATRTLRLELAPDAIGGATLRWRGIPACPALDRAALFQAALLPLRMNNDDKDRVMRILATGASAAQRIAAWHCLKLPEAVFGRLMELELIR